MSEVQKVFGCISAATQALARAGIGKNKQCNGGGNFRYRGIDDVYAALSPVLVQCGLTILPIRIEKEADAQAGKMRLVKIKVCYRVAAVEDGSYIDVEALGEGADTGDKASGKAMSYAYKSLIFQLFCVPVEGQPDSDSEYNEPESAFVDTALLERSRSAANEGREAYQLFWRSLPNSDRKILVESGEHDKNKLIAEEVDNV